MVATFRQVEGGARDEVCEYNVGACVRGGGGGVGGRGIEGEGWVLPNYRLRDDEKGRGGMGVVGAKRWDGMEMEMVQHRQYQLRLIPMQHFPRVQGKGRGCLRVVGDVRECDVNV